MAKTRLALMFTAALAACLWNPASALGQGTSEKLPDPISVSDAVRYHNHLLLSEQQRRAAERHFGTYRERFVVLRNDAIERALELDHEAFNDRLPALMVQIAAVDETFFQDVEAILSEDQLPLLEDVRLMRDRARYQSIRSFGIHSCYSFVDLREALSHVPLTGEQSERIMPMLRAHEQQLSRMMQTFFRHSTAFRSRETGEPVIEYGKRIRAMNLRMLHELEAMLEPRQADELRWRFTLQGYIRTRFAARLGVESQYAAALEFENTTQEQRDAIEAAWNALRLRRLAIHRQAIEILDANGRINTGWEDADAVIEMRIELGRQAAELNAQAVTQLHGMFDAETVERLAAVPSGTAAGSEHHYGSGMNGLMFSYVHLTPAAPRPAVVATPSDPYIPNPISEEDVQFTADLLGLDAGLAILLMELHHEYMRRFEETIQPLVDDAMQRRGGSLGFGFGEPLEGDEREAVAREHEALMLRFESRRRVIDRLHDLDSSFFRDVATILPAEAVDETAMERARLLRERQLYERGAPMGFGNWPNRASSVNLSRMVIDHAPSQQREALHQLMLEYDRDYLAAVRTRFETLFQRQIMSETGTAEVQLAETDWERFYTEYVDISRKVRQTHQAVAEVNQKYVLRLLDKLDDDTAWQLLHAFNLAAYPQVFDDPLNVVNPLAAAFGIDSLTSAQRSELGEIAAEYRPEYNRLTQALIDLTAAHYGDVPANLTLGDVEHSRNIEQFNNEHARLRFERDEVNRRATQRMRLTLNAEQIRRVGGLQSPESD